MSFETTLNKIREYDPCLDGWRTLLKTLNKTQADDEPLNLLTVLNSNGLDDTLWCLRAIEGHDSDIRLFAVWCARQVQHLMQDQRSIDALGVAEDYSNGKANQEQLDAAWDEAALASEGAAVDAALAANGASLAAVRDEQEARLRQMIADGALGDTVLAAKGASLAAGAAWDAALAAEGAAWDTALAAEGEAGDAALAAEGEAGDAALAADGASLAAWDAACDAERAAEMAAAGEAARAEAWVVVRAEARAAVRAAVRDEQEARLRQMIADGGFIGSTHPEVKS